MTVSMRVMSAGDGYEYLLRTVAAGDGDRDLSTPLTRYYTEEGTPRGRKSSRVLICCFLWFSVYSVTLDARPVCLDRLAE